MRQQQHHHHNGHHRGDSDSGFFFFFFFFFLIGMVILAMSATTTTETTTTINITTSTETTTAVPWRVPSQTTTVVNAGRILMILTGVDAFSLVPSRIQTGQRQRLLLLLYPVTPTTPPRLRSLHLHPYDDPPHSHSPHPQLQPQPQQRQKRCVGRGRLSSTRRPSFLCTRRRLDEDHDDDDDHDRMMDDTTTNDDDEEEEEDDELEDLDDLEDVEQATLELDHLTDEPDDVPEDWTEQDILAELGDDLLLEEDEEEVGVGGGGGVGVAKDQNDNNDGTVAEKKGDENNVTASRRIPKSSSSSSSSSSSTAVRSSKRKKRTNRRSFESDDNDDDDEADENDDENDDSSSMSPLLDRRNNNDDDDDDDDVDADDVDIDELDIDLYDEDEDDEDVEEGVLFEDGGNNYDEDNEGSVITGWEDYENIEFEKEGEGEDVYDLADDPDDPNYNAQKEIVMTAITAAEQRQQNEDFDPLAFITQNSAHFDPQQLIEQSPFLQAVEARVQDRNMMLTESDVAGLDLQYEIAQVSDLMEDDPVMASDDSSAHGVSLLERDVGVTDRDIENLDATYKEISRLIREEPWDKVMVKDQTPGVWENLSNVTVDEMSAALEELGGSSYNVTRWLLYDLDFNVSNLMLAAIKHNPRAPVLLQHWYPQLVTYERYQPARDRNFDFTWEDVENANVTELQQYYAGFGYDDIPLKAPAETGIISVEDLDEEEIKMAAFENWMTSIYNPEWDRTDFDDDGMRDELNVFSEFYEPLNHPDLPTFEDTEDDIDVWNSETQSDFDSTAHDNGTNDINESEEQAYKTMMGQKFEYEVIRDEEFEREFRGHLIVACTGSDHDLDIAEKITLRFESEFGKQVFVETRLMALAREEDNVFEIWLESYEIDLLHSKKRATSNTQGWSGPAECDDAQIEYLVEQVRFLISDEARYSYRMDLEHIDA